MLPAVVTLQIQDELEHFLRTTFSPSTDRFNEFFQGFFSGEEFFRGPYVSLGLPLTPRPMPDDVLTIAPAFQPYAHQIQAFTRLSGESRQSTLIATGTGSGKTESYLFPILDACAQTVGKPGIKAILIYPMNALANDQAERLAGMIWNDSRLKNKVTAGLFTGDKPGNHSVMGPHHLMTKHETMLKHPPDILLTNYRMLDLLLLRPSRASLWQGTGPDSLTFLVVDELHTFDGAQGTDLAVLIRRLKERLQIPDGNLACVGTSATIGGAGSADALRSYAAQLFGEPFHEGAVLTENVESPAEFLAQIQPDFVDLVPEYHRKALEPATYDSLEEYLRAQAGLWLNEQVTDIHDENWRVALGEQVRRIEAFQRLIRVAAGPPVAMELLLRTLAGDPQVLQDPPTKRYYRLLVASLLSLAGWARTRREDRIIPLVRVGIQLWARELRRIVAPVVQQPVLRFHSDLSEQERGQHLPVVHCRECGASGWVSYRHDSSPEQIESSYNEFVSRFFQNSPETVFLFPPEDEHEELGSRENLYRVCGECLHLVSSRASSCPHCGNSDTSTLTKVEVFQPVVTGKKDGHSHVYHNCPVCDGRDSLLLVGSRSTSLISVALAQLHASPFTEDRKVLAFSDSVQDAAHHAGFFGARTYSFNVRMAISRFLGSRVERRTQTFSGLTDRLVEHYRTVLGDERFVSVFMAPRLESLPEFDRILSAPLDAPVTIDDAMISAVKARLEWDVHAELGYLSPIGRTLERSGVVAVYSDPRLVDSAVDELTRRLSEEIGGLKKVSSSAVGRFVRGLLVRMRRRGAVRSGQLERYLEHGGHHWMIGRTDEERQYLPWAGRGTRLPAFLTDGPVSSGHFDRLASASHHTPNWYQQWTRRSLSFSGNVAGFEADILRTTMDVLVRHKVLEHDEVKGSTVWAIPEKTLLVTVAVRHLVCDHQGCNYQATVAETEAARWNEAPCPRAGCSGRLRPDNEGEDAGYYATLYRRGELSRVIPAEHSAIVASEERERIEALFSAEGADRKPWHPNLVSSTPTLEMGIDIGDLSVTVQTRVPPRPANYLQRIGRSGRKSGTALNLTVAAGRPHDLYFFKEPHAMIAADIDPPGLFLNAPYVLKRQLLAFALDQWVAGGVPDNAVPSRIQDVVAAARLGINAGSSSFPWTFIIWLEQHAHRTVERFLNRFGADELAEESREYLSGLVSAAGTPEVTAELLQHLEELDSEIRSLGTRLEAVGTSLQGINSRAHLDKAGQDEKEDLERQQKALEVIIRNLRSKNTFQFLTDEGLIPNFAFPEAGVVLRSVILRRNKRTTEKAEPLVFEYQRPAVAALSELAPESEFFGQGRKVTIQEIDLRNSELEDWRICDSCHHMEREVSASQYVTCPRCGSALWQDTGRRQKLLRMRQVVAVEKDDRSRIYDEREERTPTFFVRNLFVDVDPAKITEAWRMDGAKLPFGFEFVRQVTLRDLNFGRTDHQSDAMRFGGMEVKSGGFRICRHCGVVLPSRQNEHRTEGFSHDGGTRNTVRHAAWCPARSDEDKQKSAFSAVFLYRDYQSEALRFLIPTGMLEVERDLESFIAGLFLGLRLHFGGQIDHIRSTSTYLPAADGGGTKHFLVLYDAIPGGTGYLRQLMANGETLQAVFSGALLHMRNCVCDDGCHRCLYSYRQSRAMERISKQTAIRMFSEITEHWNHLTAVSGSIASESGNPYLESTLESAFIHALSVLPSRVRIPSVFSPAQVHGKPGWTIRVNGNMYQIEPQAHVGAFEKIHPPSKPDFVIRPVGSTGLSRPVAVFTDGYSFHADITKGNLIVGSDAEKRIAIRESDGYWVWTLTYNDVKSTLEEIPHGNPTGLTALGATGAALTGQGIQPLVERVRHGPLWALIALLAYPDESLWRRVAAVAAFSLGGGSASRADTPLLERLWKAADLRELVEPAGAAAEGVPVKPVFTRTEPSGSWVVGAAAWIAGTRSAQDELQNAQDLHAVIGLNDTPEHAGEPAFRESWNAFWTTCNILQFLPHVRWGTSSIAPVLDSRWTHLADPGTEAFRETLSLIVDERVQDLVTRLFNDGVPVPEAGFELVSPDGEVMATAELAWEDKAVVLFLEGCHQEQKLFEKEGWKTLQIDEPDILDRLQGELR